MAVQDIHKIGCCGQRINAANALCNLLMVRAGDKTHMRRSTAERYVSSSTSISKPNLFIKNHVKIKSAIQCGSPRKSVDVLGRVQGDSSLFGVVSSLYVHVHGNVENEKRFAGSSTDEDSWLDLKIHQEKDTHSEDFDKNNDQRKGKNKESLTVGVLKAINGKGRVISKTKFKAIEREEREKEKKKSTIQSFYKVYESEYGTRWPALLLALKSEFRSSCMCNRFADPLVVARCTSAVSNATLLPFLKLPTYSSSSRFPQPERDSLNLYTHYMMDAASILATEALDIQPGDRVLDLCAAPGGKSLAILQQLNLREGSLTANDLSHKRRKRLWRALMDYLPEDLRASVRVTGGDGSQWWEPEAYDKVLVDAPCSSERHLLHDHEELRSWSRKRSTNCAQRQLALLAAALKVVRVGGIVVYSTCSISTNENDNVISKAKNQLKVEFEVIKLNWAIGEPTKFGWIVLPDEAEGWGPLYFAAVKRLPIIPVSVNQV